MADNDGPGIDLNGVRVGDFHVQIVPATGTDDHLDTPQNRDRAEQAQEDEEAAKHSADVVPEHPLPDPAHPAPTPVIPLGEGGDVDASIEEARARVSDETPIPILLHDPLTGKVVESTE